MKTIIDENTGRIIMLYKLLQGRSSSSFGIKIAETVGLPFEIIINSLLKAEEFKQTAGLEEIKRTNKEFNDIIC